MTFSTDNLLETTVPRCVGAHYVLSDPGSTQGLGHRGYTDPTQPISLPLWSRLAAGLQIYNGYWFFGRPTVEELRLDLRTVLRRCRPDWDISSVEQRAAWDKGDKARFYPYGKTQAQVLAQQD